MAVQLELDLDIPRPSQRPAWQVEEDELIRLGILRHYTVGYANDRYHQSARPIRLEWDTAGGHKAGDLIPAVLCCLCGWPEPNECWLERNHNCSSGVALHDQGRTLYRWYLDGDWPTPRPAPGRRCWYPMFAACLPVDDQDDTDEPSDDELYEVTA